MGMGMSKLPLKRREQGQGRGRAVRQQLDILVYVELHTKCAMWSAWPANDKKRKAIKFNLMELTKNPMTRH